MSLSGPSYSSHLDQFMATTSYTNRYIKDFNRFMDDGNIIVYTEYGQIKEFILK